MSNGMHTFIRASGVNVTSKAIDAPFMLTSFAPLALEALSTYMIVLSDN